MLLHLLVLLLEVPQEEPVLLLAGLDLLELYPECVHVPEVLSYLFSSVVRVGGHYFLDNGTHSLVCVFVHSFHGLLHFFSLHSLVTLHSSDLPSNFAHLGAHVSAEFAVDMLPYLLDLLDQLSVEHVRVDLSELIFDLGDHVQLQFLEVFVDLLLETVEIRSHSVCCGLQVGVSLVSLVSQHALQGSDLFVSLLGLGGQLLQFGEGVVQSLCVLCELVQLSVDLLLHGRDVLLQSCHHLLGLQLSVLAELFGLQLCLLAQLVIDQLHISRAERGV